MALRAKNRHEGGFATKPVFGVEPTRGRFAAGIVGDLNNKSRVRLYNSYAKRDWRWRMIAEGKWKK